MFMLSLVGLSKHPCLSADDAFFDGLHHDLGLQSYVTSLCTYSLRKLFRFRAMRSSFRHDRYRDRSYHVGCCGYCGANFDSSGAQSEVGRESLSPFYDTALVDRDHICRFPFFVFATGNWRRGHASIVRSEVVYDESGAAAYVNQQMRRLKFLELALKCGCPVVHRIFRRVYDFVGPPLARLFRIHPSLADAAYLLLMPIEFVAEFLRFSLRLPSIKIGSLYKNHQPKEVA